MNIVSFLVAIFWGLLAGQFLMITVLNIINAFIYLIAILFSKVQRWLKITGFLTSIGMGLVYLTLLIGGILLGALFIDYSEWKASTIASVVAFLISAVYCGAKFPGQILVARMSAWQPMFYEAANALPVNERVAFAKKIRADVSYAPTRRPVDVGKRRSVL